jgi:hypothetical protein
MMNQTSKRELLAEVLQLMSAYFYRWFGYYL